MTEIIASVLTILVGALLKIIFAAIGVEIDEVIFNTIVAGIVTWFMTHLFTRVTEQGIRSVTNR
jgi:hypothetical protein